MNYPYHIQKQLDNDNYHEQCALCCCIPYISLIVGLNLPLAYYAFYFFINYFLIFKSINYWFKYNFL